MSTVKVPVIALLVMGLHIWCHSQANAATCAWPSQPPIGREASLFILAEGDSITFGNGATDGLGSYANRSPLSADPQVKIVVRARTSAILGSRNDLPPGNSLYGRMSEDNVYLSGKKTGQIFILSILIGRNDLVNYPSIDDYLTNLSWYIDRMKQAGWDRVILGTLLPSAWPPFAAVRSKFNEVVRSDCWATMHGVDAIADFGQMPTLGADSAATNIDYFADGTHPTNKGYGLMEAVYTKAVNSLRVP
jgi:hypothetical protein